MKKLIAFLLTLTMLFFVTACNSPSQNENENTVTFTDALNREITVKKKPLRVATLLGSFADVWCLAGGELCASAEDAWEDFGLTLEGCINIGGAHSISLELLISSNPEFVIASASTKSNVDMKNTLESMGITVAYFDVDNFDDYLSMLNVCTDITERKDLYEKNGVALKERINQIKSQYSKVDIPEKERKILLLRTASTFVKAKGSKGTILGEMLLDMGCINVADSDRSLLENLSVEGVIRENPHHIFVVTMGSDTEKAMKTVENMIKDNPAWNTLDAIRENRLHVMDKRLFNLKPNEEWAKSYEILYEKLTK